MQQEALFTDFASALLFETPAEIYGRVFRELRPELRPETAPAARGSHLLPVRECAQLHPHGRLAASSCGYPTFSKAHRRRLRKRWRLSCWEKMLRKPVARGYSHRYKLYLNRKDVRRQMHLVRQLRGRKMLSGPQGKHYNLEEIFEKLNVEYFDGLLGRPALGWSLHRSRTMLGHFDPSHNAIILSKIFDEAGVPGCCGGVRDVP